MPLCDVGAADDSKSRWSCSASGITMTHRLRGLTSRKYPVPRSAFRCPRWSNGRVKTGE